MGGRESLTSIHASPEADRIQTVAPQLRRLRADMQCLQEVHIQSGWRSTFISLDELFEQSWQLIQASQQLLARLLGAIGN